MAEPSKPSLFGLSAGNKNGQSGKETSLFPPPSTPAVNLEVPKDKNDMLTSFTTPISMMAGPKRSVPNGEDSMIQKKENSQIGATAENSKVQGQKIGGPMSGAAERRKVSGEKTGGIISGAPQTRNRRIGADQDDKDGPEKIEKEITSMSTLMEKIFLLKKIKSNEQVKDSEVVFIVDVIFSLTEDPKERQINLSKLKDAKQRQRLFLKISYLKNEKDPKVLQQVHLDLCIIIQKMISKSSYLSIEGCVKLIMRYLMINQSVYYPQGKFLYKNFRDQGQNFQISPKLQEILKEISQIQQNLFRGFEETLRLLAIKKANSDREKCPALVKLLGLKDLMTKLGVNIWADFLIIMKAEKEREKIGRSLTYGFELNILLSSLNYCYDLSPVFFSKKQALKSILPALRDSIYIFQDQNQVTMNNIDQLILNLLLTAPFTIANLGSTPQLKMLLQEGKIRQRYPYLILLVNDQINPGSIPPLSSCETAVFLQNYLKMNKNFIGYEPSKQAFIFNSICEIFKQNPSFFRMNSHRYKMIYEYIHYIVSSIFPDMANSGESQRNFEVEKPYYLDVCRLAKLISSACLSANGEAINSRRLEQLINRDHQIITEMLSLSFKLMLEDGKENADINCQLQLYQISTEVVYELIFRLIIYDSRYFQQRQALVLQYFQSLQSFHLTVITSHIIKFIQNTSYSHLNMLALSSMVATPSYFKTTKNIIANISSLKDFNVEMQDQQGLIFQKNELEYAVEQILKFKNNKVNTFPAVTHLLLSIMNHNPVFLQSQLVKAFNVEIRRLVDTYHPLVLTRYAETLVEVLRYLKDNRTSMKEVESCFDFRFVNLFLCQTLSFQLQKETPKICNKAMRSRRYPEVKLAVKLIKEMTDLYLKEKEDNVERVPLEVRRLLEMENKGASFQLLFNKEATSYMVGLIIVLLSREFAIDNYLRKKEPHFKDEIFQTLTNLNLISNFLKNDISLKIHHLYNRHSQIELNEGLNLKEMVVDQIKWSPSFMSLEYMMSGKEFKLDLKKQLLEKVKLKEDGGSSYDLKTKSHFIEIYWNHIASKQLRIGNEEAWAYTDNFLRSFNFETIDYFFEEDPETEQAVVGSLFKMSICMKKTCLRTYSQFLLKYSIFFFKYALNRDPSTPEPFCQHFYQAIIYFLNIKSIISPSLFQMFIRDTILQRNLYLFIIKLLEERGEIKRKQQKGDYDAVILEVVMYAVSFLIELGGTNPELQSWFGEILRRINQESTFKGDVSTKEILVTMLLHAKLDRKMEYHQLSFSNHHWLLLTNVIESNDKLSTLLLIDLNEIYDSHAVYFISACHYFLNVAKTAALEQLSQINNIKIKKDFISTLVILLHKAIKEFKSYHVVWIIEILSEIVMNEEVADLQQVKYYEQIREIVLTSQVVHSRIAGLLAKVAAQMGFEMKELQGCWRSSGPVDTHISISQKTELIAYFRLLTFIYFNPKHSTALRSTDSLLATLLQKQQQIFISIVSLVPLFSSLLSSKTAQLTTTSESQKALLQIQLDRIYSRNIMTSGLREIRTMQIHDMWQKGSSALDLLNQVSNYELISICSVWLGNSVCSNQGKFAIHNELIKKDSLDRILNCYVDLMDETTQRLERYLRNKSIVEPVLRQYEAQIYSSLAVSKDMLFTNCGVMNSHLCFGFRDISDKLGEIILGLQRILEYVFKEAKRGAVRVKAAANYKVKERNLAAVQSVLKNIDVNFTLAAKSTMQANDSQYFSQNLTRTFM